MEDKPFYQYKIGDKDANEEEITDIFCAHEDYLLYELDNNGFVNRMISSSIKANVNNISGLSSQFGQFEEYLTTKSKRKKFAQKYASIMARCLEDKLADATNELTEIINKLEKQKIVTNKIVYLMACLSLVSVNILVCIYISLSGNLDNQIAKLFTIATFGSFGGMISVSLKINKLEIDLYYNSRRQIWIAISRIFIAMISSLIVYVLIKSNLLLGIVNDAENTFVLYSLAAASGLSEYFVPNMLNAIVKKDKN